MFPFVFLSVLALYILLFSCVPFRFSVAGFSFLSVLCNKPNLREREREREREKREKRERECCEFRNRKEKRRAETLVKAGPHLEAILVVFGRRVLIFFFFESSWKNMKNDTTFVRMRSGDHLGDAKMSKKGTSLLRI